MSDTLSRPEVKRMRYLASVGHHGGDVFAAMTPAELRGYVDACRRGRDYDGHFAAACRELNGREG